LVGEGGLDMNKKEIIELLLKIKKIADDVHYHNDGENNCEYISEFISKKLRLGKYKINCLECFDKLIDCRDYIFCNYKKLRYVGRKKDYETPKWCPKNKV